MTDREFSHHFDAYDRTPVEIMVSAAATKRVLASTLGVTQTALSGFGSSFVSADIGRSVAALEGNPMTSANQRRRDIRLSGVED
jgi:hypothetical protein